MRRLFCYAFVLWVGYSYGVPIPVPPELAFHTCTEHFTRDRSGYYPFCADVTFWKFADHDVTCTSGSFDPDKVALGDTIFVGDWYLHWFMQNIHPLIKHQYILISSDSDENHPGPEAMPILYDPKVGAWFCRNLCLSNHPKLTILPYGQWFVTENDYSCYLELTETAPVQKVDFPFLYVNFGLNNNPALRNYVKELFRNKVFCYVPDHFSPKVDYWKEFGKYKFTLAPRGQGIDTMRVWESIGLGTIPIIQHSPLDDLYEGTPSVLVKSWDEVTEEFLVKKLDEIEMQLQSRIVSREKIYFDYWANKISQTQLLIRSKQWDNADLEKTKFDLSTLNGVKGILLDASVNRDSCLLLVWGKLLSLRAFQIPNCMPEFQKVLIADPYLSTWGRVNCPSHTQYLMGFAQDKSIFQNNHHYGRSEEFVSPDTLLQTTYKYKSVRLFMDLTHYYFNFTEKLWEFYQALPPGSIICGNMGMNKYVQELLDDFSLENDLPIRRQNDLWIVRKKKS